MSKIIVLDPVLLTILRVLIDCPDYRPTLSPIQVQALVQFTFTSSSGYLGHTSDIAFVIELSLPDLMIYSTNSS